LTCWLLAAQAGPGFRELRKSLFSSVAKHGKLLAGFNN
jgi:hypothetical protein